MEIGVVRQIWRYPFKSMMGERLDTTLVGTRGLVGDRAWAVRDEVRGGIRGAKKIAGLMACAARYPAEAEPAGSKVVPCEITLPDGSTVASDTPDAAARLSEALGQPVTIWPLQPADDLDHYRRGAPTFDSLDAELRDIFALESDDPLPDFSVFPPEILEFESPLGTYFDAFPLLLMTETSLASLQGLLPESVIDVRRFRPNFLLDLGEPDGRFPEAEWAGRRLRIGSAVVEAGAPCPRCVMVTRAFADLPQDRQIQRTLVRETAQSLGAYGTLVTPGEVREGDPVELV